MTEAQHKSLLSGGETQEDQHSQESQGDAGEQSSFLPPEKEDEALLSAEEGAALASANIDSITTDPDGKDAKETGDDACEEEYQACLGRLLRHRPMKLGLDDLRQVAQCLGNPQDKFQAVHVAGLRVGVFSSPHIASVRERIKVDGKLISKADFVDTFNRVRCAAEEVGAELTFFETCTLMAFEHFAAAGVKVAVVEVGLGGRLDATNILPPNKHCVVTSIGWDHMDILGDSLEAIAFEKAGIFTKFCTVALGPSAATCDAIWQRAGRLRCFVLVLEHEPRGEDFDDENSRLAKLVATEVLSLGLPPARLESALSTRLGLRGQQLSESQALKAARALGFAGEDLSLPLAVVLDVAHNQSALDRLLQMVAHRFYGKLVFAVVGLSDKRGPDVLQPFFSHLLAPLNQRFGGLYLVSGRHSRMQSAAALFRASLAAPSLDASAKEALTSSMRRQCSWLSERPLAESVDADGVAELAEEVCVPGSLPRVLRGAFSEAAKAEGVMLVCGSFFIMSEALKAMDMMEGPEDPFESNEQISVSSTRTETDAAVDSSLKTPEAEPRTTESLTPTSGF